MINISVGGDPGETSDVMDAAVNALVAMGVHVVGAAGNENVDACTESPRWGGILLIGLLGEKMLLLIVCCVSCVSFCILPSPSPSLFLSSSFLCRAKGTIRSLLI